jgi:hypothetical protein
VAGSTRPTAEGTNLAHWLGSSAFAGWLGGPLLGAAVWLARGEGEDGQFSLGPATGLLPLAGFGLVCGIYVAMARSALGVGWGRAARRATFVLLSGSAGWLAAQFLGLPIGGSINSLVLAWTALTLPYPAAAACVSARAVRPPAPVAADAPRGVSRLAAHRPQAIAAACLAATVLGMALESASSGPARAAAVPVRSADAEPEAPAGMLLLLHSPHGYAPTSYGYVNGVVTISYLGSDGPVAEYDDLEVIVAPASGDTPCAVDWAAADGDIGAAAGTDLLACTADGTGRWLAGDGIGDTLYIGRYRSYDVALAVSADSALPVSPTSLPSLFGTLHPADAGARAVLNAEEDSLGDD